MHTHTITHTHTHAHTHYNTHTHTCTHTLYHTHTHSDRPLPPRYDSPPEGVRGRWAGLPLCVVTGTDGEGYPVPSLHRGGSVQQPPIRDQRAECPPGGRAGEDATC